ncbi:tyrosine-protein phosphatase [Massilibacteroides sp.]|uniref:tyrosine-protein phosphatase n=1 Tax=Massilibacteroides sp. TaxID=2034766 RepID=UPI00261261F7|nr:tyrosine-protein phosphatase [Massilibacteroides sp.]MDD4515208.1 tyrosine-protein phosphatase [Massilibacteroides sp.]
MFNSCSYKNDPAEEPSRILPIEGAYNVRDLGGYQAADNKTVKWKKVIRSGDLNLLTDKDLVCFEAIPLKSYVDFRHSEEIRSAPDKYPVSIINQFHLPVETGNILSFQKMTPEFAETALVDINKYFVRESQNTYKRFFEILMDGEKSPLLFHCSAGKDRTGFAAALFLASLGVDRETIINDYLLTNECLKDKYADLTARMPILKPLFEVRQEYILGAFDVIDNEYGGMEKYLTNQLGVDLNRMRELYTE